MMQLGLGLDAIVKRCRTSLCIVCLAATREQGMKGLHVCGDMLTSKESFSKRSK